MAFVIVWFCTGSGIELGSSCLHSKHFTEWAISLLPGLRPQSWANNKVGSPVISFSHSYLDRKFRLAGNATGIGLLVLTLVLDQSQDSQHWKCWWWSFLPERKGIGWRGMNVGVPAWLQQTHSWNSAKVSLSLSFHLFARHWSFPSSERWLLF